VNTAVGPYVKGALVGLVIGAVVGLVALLLVAKGGHLVKLAIRGRRSPRPSGSASVLRHDWATPLPSAASAVSVASGAAAASPSTVGFELTREELLAFRMRAREAILGALRELGGSAQRSAVLDRARAAGEFTSKEIGAPPIRDRGRSRERVEHELSWALTNLKRDGLVENPARNMWRLTASGRAGPEAALEQPVANERIQELRVMPYHEYLRTPEWRATRAAALMRAGHRCSLDSSHRGGLEVHHNSYERLGAELAADLVVLCRDCHRRHHQAQPPA
jgi:hypothetical protein